MFRAAENLTVQPPILAQPRVETPQRVEIYVKAMPIAFVSTIDTEFDVERVPDDIDSNEAKNIERQNRIAYRESDLNFIRFLAKQRLLIDDSNGGCVCPNFKKRGEKIEGIEFFKVVDALEYAYLTDEFCDPDLEDDVYGHGSIVKPSEAYELKEGKQDLSDSLMNRHSALWQLSFKTEEDKREYYKSRSNLYCQYAFMRRLAILYRDTPIKAPFIKFMEFYHRYKGSGKDAVDLRVTAVAYADQNWTTGLHEWLMCASFEEAMRRTAGLRRTEGITSHLSAVKSLLLTNDPFENQVRGLPADLSDINNVSPKDILDQLKDNSWNLHYSEFNWLDYQFLIRTRYEHIIYRNNLEGHTGCINESKYPAERGKGWLTMFPAPKGQGFDRQLTALFMNARIPGELIYTTYQFYFTHILHDQTPEYGREFKQAGYTATGVSTTNIGELETFRREQLKKAHDQFKMWLRDLCIQNHIARLQPGQTIQVHYEEGHILPVEFETDLSIRLSQFSFT